MNNKAYYINDYYPGIYAYWIGSNDISFINGCDYDSGVNSLPLKYI